MAKKTAKTNKENNEDAVEVVETTNIDDVVSSDDVETSVELEVSDVKTTTAEAADDIGAISDELEHTSSLSSKILTGLVLMTVGGGLALWAAPKIAPNLPAGLAPVANFLAPGQASATQQVADLRADLDAKVAELTASGASNEAITAAIAEYDATNSANYKKLSDQLAAADSATIESRLATVETQLTGVTAELGSLRDQLSSVDLSNGNIDAASAAKLAGFAATIEGLKAEMTAMAAKQGNLSQKIDEVSVTSERKVKEAEVKVAIVETQKELTDLTNAIETGVGFEPALAALAANGVEIPDLLTSAAASGVPTMAKLKADFAKAAHSAIKADTQAKSSDGLGSTFTNFFKSQVTVRSLEPQEGDDANAVLSRVQGALDAGDLAGAVAQAETLQGAAQSVLADWLELAKTRASVLAAVGNLSTSLNK